MFVGILIGSLVWGVFSDRYGRKPALLAAITTVSVASLIGAFMPSAAGYGFFRFLMGKVVVNTPIFRSAVLKADKKRKFSVQIWLHILVLSS